jgi:hypothetical protein
MDDNGTNVTQFRVRAGARVGAARPQVRVIVNCGNAVPAPAHILHFVTSPPQLKLRARLFRAEK